MTRPEPELFRHIGPRPTRPGIDLAKLATLTRDCSEKRAVLDNAVRQTHDARDDIQHANTHFPASPAAAAHWRPGDDTAVFLEMPDDLAAQFPAEVRAARRIKQDKEALAALRARIDALHARHSVLTQLVKACEAYAHCLEG